MSDEESTTTFPLEVTIFRGKDIHSHAQIQKKPGSEEDRPTSFVTIKIGKASWSGMNVRGKNPVWNTYTTFEEISLSRTKLRVDVVDVDGHDQKHTVGTITLPLDMLHASHGYLQRWYPLNEDPSHSRGLIKVKLVWLNPAWEGAQREADAKPAEKLPTPMSPKSLAKYKAEQESGWFHKAAVDEGMPTGPIKTVDTEGMDTEQIIYETERVKGESLASTRRAIAQLEETKQLGAAIAVELDAQGRQLKSTEHQLDTIDAYMDDSARKIRATKSIGGMIANLFTRNKGKKKLKELEQVRAADAVSRSRTQWGPVEKSEERREIENRNKLAVLSHAVAEPEPVVDDKKKKKKKKDALMEDVQPTAPPPKPEDPGLAEIDDNLDVIGGHLTDLKKMALHMGHEINDHTSTINAMQTKTAQADAKIRTQAAILKRPVETQRRH